jgi:hypothetical protein
MDRVVRIQIAISGGEDIMNFTEWIVPTLDKNLTASKATLWNASLSLSVLKKSGVIRIPLSAEYNSKKTVTATIKFSVDIFEDNYTETNGHVQIGTETFTEKAQNLTKVISLPVLGLDNAKQLSLFVAIQNSVEIDLIEEPKRKWVVPTHLYITSFQLSCVSPIDDKDRPQGGKRKKGRPKPGKLVFSEFIPGEMS